MWRENYQEKLIRIFDPESSTIIMKTQGTNVPHCFHVHTLLSSFSFATRNFQKKKVSNCNTLDIKMR